MNASAPKLLCVAAVVSCLCLPASAAERTAAPTASATPVIVTPPEPQALADMLFAPWYRDARGQSQPSPRLVDADASGSAEYNQNFSERRAAAIRDYLVAGFEISAERLVTVGFGKTRPYDGADPFNPLNRRAAFRPLVAR